MTETDQYYIAGREAGVWYAIVVCAEVLGKDHPDLPSLLDGLRPAAIEANSGTC